MPRFKAFLFRLLGKEPDAVAVSFLSGEERLSEAMAREIRRLVPDRRHYVVALEPRSAPELAGCITVTVQPGSLWSIYRQLRRAFWKLRIGIAPVLFTGDPAYRPLRQAAFLLAPRKILAYNSNLERHHLKLRTAIASWLFLRGVPLDRIFLRPRWLCPWKKDRSEIPTASRILEGRALSPLRRRAAVLSPYSPYPLSHGGAVRIYHLLREAASDFDIFLFAFSEGSETAETAPVLEFCARLILVDKPRYREPRWASIEPPEALEYRSPAMSELWTRLRREYRIEVQQVEYTQLAPYGGDVLVEHDITQDLYRQVYECGRTRSSWWNWWRWRRFENRAAAAFARVVVMSDKDAWLLGLAQGRLLLPNTRIIPNGVDLDRFRPEPETPGERLLFIGSFRHFPNIVAYRFFMEQVWPLLRERFPEMTLTVVAGPDPLIYWKERAGTAEPAPEPRVRILGLIRDVRPLYVECNLAIVPTLVSAGTNLKVLEAMAMERAVVSTSSGCAGLDLKHGESIWIGDTAEDFARGVAALLKDAGLRRRIAAEARRHAEGHFDWRKLGELQRELWEEVASAGLVVRNAEEVDLGGIARIQSASPEAVSWDPRSYLVHQCRVAVLGEHVAGFAVARRVSPDEYELLNLAVDPKLRRHGVASALVRDLLRNAAGEWFLELRESNLAARNLYEKFGFREVGRRAGYYQPDGESAVVMRIQSC